MLHYDWYIELSSYYLYYLWFRPVATQLPKGSSRHTSKTVDLELCTKYYVCLCFFNLMPSQYMYCQRLQV
jgi:hypothetical protein